MNWWLCASPLPSTIAAFVENDLDRKSQWPDPWLSLNPPNLQHHFDAVVHYDLAWNPTRHDQREGRVDRFGQQRDVVKVVTVFGKDNVIDGRVLEVLIRKHRQIRKDLGISVSIPESAASEVTDAIVEYLLENRRTPEQGTLFGADELDLGPRQLALDDEWNSAAEREKSSRTRYAQRSIHPEEVAREVAAVRETLGRASEVSGFVEHALTALDGVLWRDSDGGFTADLTGSPVGVRDAVASALGRSVDDGPRVPFRATAAVARREVAMVRTDPVVGALAGYVLDAALDTAAIGPRPARRCGVIRTGAVTVRTTLLLVRYRFHLTLPSRTGERQLVAEDARLQFDARWVLGLPPKGESELAWVQHCLAHVRPGGRAVIVLPPGVASRRSGRSIRAALLRRGLLRAVISLPPGAVAPAHLPMHLWVLAVDDGDATDRAWFVDTGDHPAGRARSLGAPETSGRAVPARDSDGQTRQSLRGAHAPPSRTAGWLRRRAVHQRRRSDQ